MTTTSTSTPTDQPGAGAPATPPPGGQGTAFLATALRKRLKAVRREIPGVRAGEDIECMHDIRVALRRLRCALTVLADFFPERLIKRWRKPVRRLTRTMGAARDTDVQIEFLKAFLKNAADRRCRPGIRRLLLRLTQQRAGLQAKVLRELDRFEKAGVAEALDLALRQKQVRARLLPRRGALPLKRLYQTAFHCLTDLLEAMLAYETQVMHPERVAELHRMRIAARRLRYAIEVFAPLYPDRLEDAHNQLTEIQQILGDIHDCDLWIEYLPTFLEAEQIRARNYCGRSSAVNRLKPGLDYLAKERQQRRAMRYREFIARWQVLQKQKYWEQFCRSLQLPLRGRTPRRGATS